MHNFKLQFPFSCKMTNPYAGIKSRKTPSCLRQRFSHFHPYDKLCGHSLFRFFGKADISLMGFHDLFGNGKPQTGSLFAVAGLIPHGEGFKDNIRDLRRDSLSVVRYGDLDAVSLSRNLKAQYGSLLIVPQRIGASMSQKRGSSGMSTSRSNPARAISLYLAAKYSLANSQIFSLFSVGLKSGCSSLLYS